MISLYEEKIQKKRPQWNEGLLVAGEVSNYFKKSGQEESLKV
jgi:hypothetical protein